MKKKVLVTQLCPTLCDPMDGSPPGSFVHGILQARMLEWVVTSFSRGSSQPRDRTQVSRIAGRFFTIWTTRKRVFVYYSRWQCYVLVPEIHRPQWNRVIELGPTVTRDGSQNPHDEVQMVSQSEWLKGMPYGHVGQSLGLRSALTLNLLCMWPSPRKGFYSCCIFQINYSVLQTTPCLHPNYNSFYPVHVTLSSWLYHLASLSGPTRYCQSQPTWYHWQA